MMRKRPILLSSGSTFLRMESRNFSRSVLICSIVSEATVRRSWPKMISRAISSISRGVRPSKRSAALFMIASRVLTPMVNVLGTLMRMFCIDRAFSKGMPMVIGVRVP